MQKNGLIYFLLLWIVSICSVSCSCDMKILHGDVSWCLPDDTLCLYSCNEGYNKHETVLWLRCSTSGQWVTQFWQVSAKDLCTPKPCPTVISKGTFSAACNLIVGSTCSFSCKAGYMRNTSVSQVTCQTSTEWSPDLRSLCLRPDGQQCPYYIPRGDLSLACTREPGHTCSFTCDEGYRPTISPPTLVCGSDLKWNHNTESLCQETICPKFFEGGSVSESCSRKYKATCSEYQCNPGYAKLSRAYAVQCNKSGDWVNPDEWSPPCFREDQLCPYTFPGGYMRNCNRIPQDSCTYYCYSGYLQNSSITWLTCQENRLWNVDTNFLCIQSDISNTSLSTTFRTTSSAATTRTNSFFPTFSCNMQIPHGEINWWCATIGQTCTYSCHEGYKQSDTVSFLKCSTSGQWVLLYPYWLDGVQFSIEDLCTQDTSNISSSITFLTTSPAATTRKTALSPELRTSISDERSGGGNVGTIVGISVGALTGILIIVIFILVWYGKRISVPHIRDTVHVRNTCLRPRENPVRNVTTIRQQHHADGMGSVSSFDSPSYNGLYVQPYVQRISTINNSCKYHGPPPSYSSIPHKESLPTYEEVTRNPSKFNLYI